MDVLGFHSYLARARRDLWTLLETVPDAVLAREVIPGTRFRSVKDLLVHIPVVEDSWLNYDILQEQAHHEAVPLIAATRDGPYAATPLGDILEYWHVVEGHTQGYLARFTPSESGRSIVEDGDTLSVEDVLWHVMQHEVRHTAQVALLLRQAGFSPPQLD